MIRAVMFDIGGVILKDDFLSFFAGFEDETGKTKEELYSLFFGRALQRYERGEIGAEEYWRVCRECGISPKLLKEIKNGWTCVLKPMEGSMDIVMKLRGRYRLGAVTNVIDQMAEFIRRRFDVYRLFDVVILSYEVGMRKPEPGIYRLALERLGVRPEESVFIDNTEENVEGARRLGIRGIVFKNPEELRLGLKRLGVEI